jgi:hypothetical protein
MLHIGMMRCELAGFRMRCDLKIKTLIVAWLVAAVYFGMAAPVNAVPRPPVKPAAETVCSTISQEARRRGLPESFFARLIWKESLFDPKAISPKGAQGIAQFMPDTAKDRGLADPFLAAQALSASADLLADLRDAFGNLGLAAAAYNAGEDRVRAWLSGLAELPLETLDYVLFVTGRPAADWMKSESSFTIPAIGRGEDFAKDCIALASRQPNPATAPSVSGDWKPWGAQLAGAPSEAAALAAFQRLRQIHGDVLADMTPLIIRKRIPGMGSRRRVHVQFGADSRADAERFCGRLRAQGGVCMVMRN